MRILDEKRLKVVWSWGQPEKLELTERFRDNLHHLKEVLGMGSGKMLALTGADLELLAGELQDAGQLLSESRERCYSLSQKLHVYAGATEQERQQREIHLKMMKKMVGQPVELRSSSSTQFDGRALTLESIKGINGVVRCDGEYWQVSLFKLYPVEATVYE